MILACETARGRVRGHRQLLGFARIHVGGKRYERLAQFPGRVGIARASCAYAKGGCGDKNNSDFRFTGHEKMINRDLPNYRYHEIS